MEAGGLRAGRSPMAFSGLSFRGRRENGQALAGECGGLERDEEAVDRDDVDVSLAALEPTIAYDAAASVTMEVIASSIRPVASSIMSAYAWVRPRLGGFTDAGEEWSNLPRWCFMLVVL